MLHYNKNNARQCHVPCKLAERAIHSHTLLVPGSAKPGCAADV